MALTTAFGRRFEGNLSIDQAILGQGLYRQRGGERMFGRLSDDSERPFEPLLSLHLENCLIAVIDAGVALGSNHQ